MTLRDTACAFPLASEPGAGWSSAPRWPPEEVASLALCLRRGLSYAQAARELGRTRDAVSAKARRLKLRPPMSREAVSSANATLQTARARCGDPFAPPPAGHAAQAVAELTASACRWPIGDPRAPGFRFCGGHAPHGPYCAHHRHTAHVQDRGEPLAA
jgi:GcrA cell cycle regulator